MTRPEDAIAAAQLGADAVGLVFYAKSPRNLQILQAREICHAMPAFVSRVALFLNPHKSLVEQVIADAGVDLLQFHGTEPEDFCRSFRLPYIKALGTGGENSLSQQVEQYSSAQGLLLDSHAQGEAGGTGETFDWSSIPAELKSRIILAGGLKPDNVAEAIQQVRPYAVDLSSGVESAPGIKDINLMTRLMQEIKRVDCE